MSQTPTRKPTTKQRIHAAAVRAFTEKGFAATTTRDIAALADVNVATLHYHHRSKEELFASVAAEQMSEFNRVFDEAVARSETVEDFVRLLVHDHTEHMLSHPYLCAFIIGESEKNPAAFAAQADFADWGQRIGELLARDHAAGRIRAVDTAHFVSDVVGMLTYPFMTRATTAQSHGMSEADFRAFARARAGHIQEVMMAYLRA